MQNYNLKFTIFILVLTLNFALLTLNLSTVQAQESIPLQIAPARQELTLSPGKEAFVTVKIYNLSDFPTAGILKAADFEVTDREGGPRIIEDISQASPKFSASQWITLPYDGINIAAQDRATIQVKIQAPSDAKPGGRYVAVYFEPTGRVPQSAGSVKEAGSGIASRIASLFYIKVPGATSEKAIVSRLFASSLLEYGPVDVESEIINRGDYHVRPRGTINLSNMFGEVEGQDKLKEQNIFPDATRTYKNTIGRKWMLGRYKISISASYGDRGQALDRFIYVWVFPWKVASALMLALIVFLLFSRKFYKKVVVQENKLEAEIEAEKKEIEKLKEQLRKKQE